MRTLPILPYGIESLSFFDGSPAAAACFAPIPVASPAAEAAAISVLLCARQGAVDRTPEDSCRRSARSRSCEGLRFTRDGSALVANATDSWLDLSDLDLTPSTTYYWQVNEVNDLADPPVYEGTVWHFTTP